MKRLLAIISALVASNLFAWLLLVVTSPVMVLIHDMASGRWDSSLFMMLIMFYLGPVYILIAFAPLSIIMVLMGLVLHRHSRKDCIVGGILTGLGFHLSFSVILGLQDACVFATGAPIGAICGWVYWRIAIGRTPSNGHAIEAA